MVRRMLEGMIKDPEMEISKRHSGIVGETCREIEDVELKLTMIISEMVEGREDNGDMGRGIIKRVSKIRQRL